MVSLQTPVCDYGWKAPPFNLLCVDGNTYGLDEVRGPKGLLVMFICNHCPYVKAIRPRLVNDLRELRSLGVHAVGIMSNDPTDYPEDGYENMKLVDRQFDFPFPYLIDPSQAVAKAYGAVCTPDFFGFNANLELQYRGRFDESRKEASAGTTRDLFYAMKQVSETGHGPTEQIPSMGCSIKWIEGK